tara:strand:+ start:269 stop:457 length:189 start_codon:yes stop_codon:yes gene_type:complete
MELKMTFSKYQLNKMEQMLKAIHNPNFEQNLKKAADKLAKEKNKVNEMDLVKEINKGGKNES